MMHQRTIRLCYRKIIDATSTKTWERYVFDDTYTEFLLQAQFFNRDKKYSSFIEILNNVPGAEKLHALVSSAVIGYLKQLNGMVPDILNSLGTLFLPFENYRFEIIHSDIKDKKKHQVAINFYSDPLLWHEKIGNKLLVSLGGKDENGETLTELFSLQPFLSIYSIKS